MKYKAIIETDDFEDFEFFEDGNGKYIRGIDAGAVNNEWIVVYFTECKQESILDKVRAEIEQLTITKGGDDYVRQMAELFSLKRKVLQIIDKYKAEMEREE